MSEISGHAYVCSLTVTSQYAKMSDFSKHLPRGIPVAAAIPLSSRPYGSGKVAAIAGY
jgi:hypothetical protein